MEMTDFVTWGFQVLLVGGAGSLVYAIRKLREQGDEMEKQLADLEKRLVENYVKRPEVSAMLSHTLDRIENKIEILERHMSEKFELLKQLVERGR